jgi:predicted ester cyclase
MSIKENKALVRRVYELSNKGEIASTYDFYAPGCIFHGPYGDTSVEQVKNFDAMLLVAFPDINYTIEDMVAEGDKVAYRVTIRGTHRVEFMGIAPTGKKVEFTSTDIVRIAGKKWVEWWANIDMLRLMQQLGAIPSQ